FRAVGSVRGEDSQSATANLHGHAAGNGGHRQGTPTVTCVVLSYSAQSTRHYRAAIATRARRRGDRVILSVHLPCCSCLGPLNLVRDEGGKLPAWSAGCSAIVTSRTQRSLASLRCPRRSPAHWDTPGCGSEPFDQKIEEHTDLRQAVASGEIESGYGQRLCVMGVRQQWYQQPAADRLPKHHVAEPHDARPIEGQPQRGLAVISRHARRYLDMIDSVSLVERPAAGSRPHDDSNM